MGGGISKLKLAVCFEDMYLNIVRLFLKGVFVLENSTVDFKLGSVSYTQQLAL